MKRCSNCKETKDFSEFYKNKARKGGYANYCKVCEKQRYQDNREAGLEYRKQQYQDNREARLEYAKQRYQDNREARLEYQKQYFQNNPEVGRNNNRKRRAMKRAIQENYTKQDEQRTRNLFGHKCFNCGCKENLHIDHHKPLSKGYGLDRYNAVLLCGSCNCSKHTKMPEDFYSEEQLELLNFMLNIVQ